MAAAKVAAAILDWHDRAACRGVSHYVFSNDTELLPDGSPRAPYDHAEAKCYCQGCPVRVECLEDALGRGDLWIVRGGMDPQELRAERRRRQRKRTAA
jgi:WhiB family redox-sensing transcriptional regulator